MIILPRQARDKHRKNSKKSTFFLGYANAKLYRCTSKQCGRPACYASHGSAQSDRPRCEQPRCDGTLELLRHVSFVDCPGHELLMSTMLNGVRKTERLFRDTIL